MWCTREVLHEERVWGSLLMLLTLLEMADEREASSSCFLCCPHFFKWDPVWVYAELLQGWARVYLMAAGQVVSITAADGRQGTCPCTRTCTYTDFSGDSIRTASSLSQNPQRQISAFFSMSSEAGQDFFHLNSPFKSMGNARKPRQVAGLLGS